MAKLCPCGSDLLFHVCCGAIIGGASARSAEALMRSRYSAYVLGRWSYLWQSWHPDTRPGSVSPTSTQWLGLNIIKSTISTVEFIAGFRLEQILRPQSQPADSPEQGDVEKQARPDAAITVGRIIPDQFCYKV